MAQTSITDWIGAVMAVLGGGGAVVQYFRNSRQSRAIKAADEIDALLKNCNVRAVLRMIDWTSGTVMLGGDANVPHTVFVNEQVFLLSLRYHTVPRDSVVNYKPDQDTFALERQRDGKDWKRIFSPDEQAIRDAFDDFLSRLERIESLMKNGVIAESDRRPFFVLA
jgi:hypothetical protein